MHNLRYATILVILLMSLNHAQAAVTDHYEHSGKLATIVACVDVILIGIGLFLFYLERRVKKLEDQSET